MDWIFLLQKTAASLFIILMGILLLFWCLPEGYVIRDLIHRKFGHLVVWAGLDNFWALFAPQPVSRNFLLGFELEFPDGRIQPWKLPEFSLRDDGYQQTPHLRFVKMHNQWLLQKDAAPKEGICRFVYQAYRKAHPTSPEPVCVHIIRFYEPDSPDVRGQFPWLSKRVFSLDLPQTT